MFEEQMETNVSIQEELFLNSFNIAELGYQNFREMRLTSKHLPSIPCQVMRGKKITYTKINSI